MESALPDSPPNLSELEEKPGYVFKDKGLLWEAVSFPYNRRLALLGDAVLDLLVIDELQRSNPNQDLGKYTNAYDNAVNNMRLASVIKSMQIAPYFMVYNSYGAENIQISQIKRLANGFEAIAGAIYKDSYKDSALEAIRKFVVKYVLSENKQTTASPPVK